MGKNDSGKRTRLRQFGPQCKQFSILSLKPERKKLRTFSNSVPSNDIEGEETLTITQAMLKKIAADCNAFIKANLKQNLEDAIGYDGFQRSNFEI